MLNLVSVMMSILGLQNAIFPRFFANVEDYHRMMNAIIGGYVYGIVIIIIVSYMQLHGRKHRKEDVSR